MAFSSAHTAEVTRLRIRDFSKVTLGGGIRLLKCEACGRLTSKGTIIDRDIVEEGAPERLEKTGYERWILCPECASKISDRVNTFANQLIEDVQKIQK